jgi:hypothetical protein
MTMTHAHTSDRSRLRAYLDANGQATVAQLAAGLHWELGYAWERARKAAEQGVVRIVRSRCRKDHLVLPGNVKPRFPEIDPKRKTPNPEAIAGPSLRSQECRRRLAEIERAKSGREAR